MSTADVTAMDDLERDLQLALAWEPPARVAAAMDRRVAAAGATLAPARRSLWSRSRWRVALLVAAALALMWRHGVFGARRPREA